MSRRIIVLVNDLGNNGLVRPYVLWLLARQLGWQLEVRGPGSSGIWSPLGDHPFASHCRSGQPSPSEVASTDVLVAIKATRTTFGTALRLGRQVGCGVLLDVDEPHLEPIAAADRTVLADRARGIATGRYRPVATATVRLAARRAPRTVSNPALNTGRRSVVVPHVQTPRPAGAEHTREQLAIGFIGTTRGYKGVGLLREAAARVDGATLTITDTAPADRRPHERWVGPLSMAASTRLLDSLDVSVIPSSQTNFTARQLPMKLIDAMLSGRAVVATDLPPIRWALGDTGMLVPPDDRESLASALHDLRDPALRSDLGQRARRRALEHFTPQAVAEVWGRAIEEIAG